MAGNQVRDYLVIPHFPCFDILFLQRKQTNPPGQETTTVSVLQRDERLEIVGVCGDNEVEILLITNRFLDYLVGFGSALALHIVNIIKFGLHAVCEFVVVDFLYYLALVRTLFEFRSGNGSPDDIILPLNTQTPFNETLRRFRKVSVKEFCEDISLFRRCLAEEKEV